MDATIAQRRDELKALIDERFQGVVSDRAYSRLKEAASDYREHPFKEPKRLLELPADEAAERQYYMRQIRKTIRRKKPDFEFEFRHVVAMMMVRMEAFHVTGPLAYGKDPKLLLKSLKTIYGFQRHFVQQPPPPEDQSDDDQQQGSPKKIKIYDPRTSRKPGQKELCKKRDGDVCILTGAAHPHACHIVPFAFNSTKANTEKTRTYIDAIGLMFGKGFQKTWQDKLADPSTKGRGATDKVWNMLCLSPQLHDYWAKGYFALKFMSSETNGDRARVELQFHWMPVTTFAYDDRAEGQAHWDAIEAALTAHLGDVPTNSKFPRTDPGVVQGFLPSGERLATGHLFFVEMPLDELPNFEAMIELQWAAIRMLAICGGAGNPDLLGQDDDEDDVAGASVGGFNAPVLSPSIAPSHADSDFGLSEQMDSLTV